jgi:hypothetical protein
MEKLIGNQDPVVTARQHPIPIHHHLLAIKSEREGHRERASHPELGYQELGLGFGRADLTANVSAGGRNDIAKPLDSQPFTTQQRLPGFDGAMTRGHDPARLKDRGLPAAVGTQQHGHRSEAIKLGVRQPAEPLDGERGQHPTRF